MNIPASAKVLCKFTITTYFLNNTAWETVPLSIINDFPVLMRGMKRSTWAQWESTIFFVECRCFSLSVYSCDLRLSRKSRSRLSRQEAGHDNEAQVLHKLLLLLAGHRVELKTQTRRRNVVTETLHLSVFLFCVLRWSYLNIISQVWRWRQQVKQEMDVKCWT